MRIKNKARSPLYICTESKTQELFTYIKNIPNIADKSTHLCIAVSTGVDSMVLLHSLHMYFIQYGYALERITILHYHHQQREESNNEYSALRNHCFSFGLRFVSASYYDGEKKNISENKMRKSRYAFFDRYVHNIASIYSYSTHVLCLGHHLDDRIETTFMNMQRGSSLPGILNMTPELCKKEISGQAYWYSRPFLSVSKVVLNEIAFEYDITYYTDVTNFDSDISQRNAFRNVFSRQVFDIALFRHSRDDTYTALQLFMTELDTLSSFNIKKLLPPCFWSEVVSIMLIDGIYQPYDVVKLLKKLDVYINMSTGKIIDIYSFFTHFSGWKRVGDYIFYNAHGDIYAIKYTSKYFTTLNAKKALPSLSQKTYEMYYVQYTKKQKIIKSDYVLGTRDLCIHGKTFSKRCINKKIPYFLRDSLALKKDIHGRYQLLLPRSHLINHK